MFDAILSEKSATGQSARLTPVDPSLSSTKNTG